MAAPLCVVGLRVRAAGGGADTGADGQPLIDANGQPIMGWVKHITFSGSNTLAEDMADLDLSEPVQCQIIRQPCSDRPDRAFYTLAEWEETKYHNN